jgi:TetR/AcrR family transcriptional regulator of autoinduction and epiphytic fitness
MDGQIAIAEKKHSYRAKYKRMGLGRSRGELRSDILNAALELLRDGSYETLSMEDVAALASTSRRTLYNLFQDKDELYRDACERLIRKVAELAIDEIPEQMTVSDGLRYFVISCEEVYTNPSGKDLVMLVAREGSSQAWLSQSYHREVHGRLIRACENFLLKKARRLPLEPATPRLVGEQVSTIIKSMAVSPSQAGQTGTASRDAKIQTDIVVKAYTSVFENSSFKN